METPKSLIPWAMALLGISLLIHYLLAYRRWERKLTDENRTEGVLTILGQKPPAVTGILAVIIVLFSIVMLVES